MLSKVWVWIRDPRSEIRDPEKTLTGLLERVFFLIFGLIYFSIPASTTKILSDPAAVSITAKSPVRSFQEFTQMFPSVPGSAGADPDPRIRT
jgi:hypothetical protein